MMMRGKDHKLPSVSFSVDTAIKPVLIPRPAPRLHHRRHYLNPDVIYESEVESNDRINDYFHVLVGETADDGGSWPDADDGHLYSQRTIGYNHQVQHQSHGCKPENSFGSGRSYQNQRYQSSEICEDSSRRSSRYVMIISYAGYTSFLGISLSGS